MKSIMLISNGFPATLEYPASGTWEEYHGGEDFYGGRQRFRRFRFISSTTVRYFLHSLLTHTQLPLFPMTF